MDRIITIACFAALAALSTGAPAEPEVRTLGRMLVQHCAASVDAPPVVVVSEVMVDGETVAPGVEVEGELDPELSCTLTDSRDVDGELIVWGGDSRPITSLLYTARTTSGAVTYRAADWVDALTWTPAGDQYRVASSLLLTEDGGALEYDLHLLRRAPEEQRVVVDDTEHSVPNYDQATILLFSRDTAEGSLTYILDYRGSAD